MVIEVGEKVHVVYRSLYEKSIRRHFIGKVMSATGALCRIEGFAFIYDERKDEFIKKPGVRTTIIDLAESGYIVNVVNPNVVLEDVHYKYASGLGLIVTDEKEFTLDINEFSFKSTKLAEPCYI